MQHAFDLILYKHICKLYLELVDDNIVASQLKSLLIQSTKITVLTKNYITINIRKTFWFGDNFSCDFSAFMKLL